MEKEINKMYEELMVLAHNIEDKLSYDETEEGKKWGLIVNKLQEFDFHLKIEEEKEIPITYGLIKATCGWYEFAEVTNRNIYTVKEFGDFKANEVFYITESQAKQLKFI